LLYPVGDRDRSSNLETIRTASNQAFPQESVLRVDSQACIAF
jgi:Protein of unknown function (DUF3574)